VGLESALGLEVGFNEKLRIAVESVSGLLIDSYLNRSTLNTLYNLCDCFVSLHRSEGFGLSMAEAMYLGKPCIATGYSGNLDFMTHANSYLVEYKPVVLERDYGPYAAGSHWADPNIEQAAQLMQQVVNNPTEAAHRGLVASQDIRQFYNIDVTGRAIVQRLNRIASF
jgi:glycosyltransferase involved in cell wall biosynthesis